MDRRSFLKALALMPWIYLSKPTQFRLRQASPQQPNIIIVVFDALSARNLSLYGYPRRTAPNLERLSERALVYWAHHSPANYTAPSTASLFSGRYPFEHMVYHFSGQAPSSMLMDELFSIFSPSYETIAYSHNNFVNSLIYQVRASIDEWKPTHELGLYSVDPAGKWFSNDYNTADQGQELSLWRRGYPSASFFLARFSRLNFFYQEQRLNRRFASRFPRGIPHTPNIYFTLEDAFDWAARKAQEAPQPYFAYIHLMLPHSPYLSRAEFVDQFLDDYRPPEKPEHAFRLEEPELIDYNRRMYDESIAYCDAEFARFYAALERIGALDNTVLVFTSDHGEIFERGIWQHDTPVLYEPLLHIPLVIWAPWIGQRRDIHSLTNTIDLLPTLASLAQINLADPAEAGERLPELGGSVNPGRAIFAVEAKENPRYSRLNKATLAVIRKPYKLIEYRGYDKISDSYELYDIENDPEEMNNLVEQFPEIARDLGELLQQEIDQKTRTTP